MTSCRGPVTPHSWSLRIRFQRELLEREALPGSWTTGGALGVTSPLLNEGDVRSVPVAIRLTARLGLPPGKTFQPFPFSRDPSQSLVVLRPVPPPPHALSSAEWSSPPSYAQTMGDLSSSAIFGSTQTIRSLAETAPRQSLTPDRSELGRLSQISFLNDLSDSVEGLFPGPGPSNLQSQRPLEPSSSPDEVL